VRREGLAAPAHAAWQRGDSQEALRWLTDDFTLLQTHTVNSHLRNAFAELGIRSRTELGRFINTHHEPVVAEPWPN
jgi:hypothetical protein